MNRRTILPFSAALFLCTGTAMAQAGSLDLSFNPGDVGYGYGDGANGYISAICEQPDGKVLIGGAFSSYNGTARNHIARINAEGSMDTGFNPGTGANDLVRTIVPQPDGKIIIGGDFTSYNGTTRNLIARLNADGSLDTGFNPGTGASWYINCVALQQDGKILVGGNLYNGQGAPSQGIARLNADGSLDTSFAVGMEMNSWVYDIGLQPNGKILIGGGFTSCNGTPRNHIALLNADGSLDMSFDPGTGVGSGDINSRIYGITMLPDGKLLAHGNFSSYNGTVCDRLIRLNDDGGLDTSFVLGMDLANGISEMTIQPDGRILVANGPGDGGSLITRLNTDGGLDISFDPWESFGYGFIGTLAVRPDGRILIGGGFTNYNGTPRDYIVRLNSDGSLDTGFGPGGTGANGTVRAMARWPDGRILAGGSFDAYDGTFHKGIVVLNPDGSSGNSGTGVGGTVRTTVMQPDGKAIIGGTFEYDNGSPAPGIARLNPDGGLDTNFSAISPFTKSLALQADGKILQGGQTLLLRNTDGSLDTTFSAYINGGVWASVGSIAHQPDGRIIAGWEWTDTQTIWVTRLNIDGSADNTFAEGVGSGTYLVGSAIALQPDGKILIGGSFTSYNGAAYNHIVRLTPHGDLDTSFNPGAGADSTILELVLQEDGKILIGGDFTSYNGTPRNRIARLNADGSLDTSFDPGSGANGTVHAITLQPDGRILIGGDFTSYDGVGRNRIARLMGDEVFDCEGVLGGPALPGTPCDDGNANTINDSLTTDCQCAGDISTGTNGTAAADAWFTIRPNPSSGTFQLVSGATDAPTGISVYDALGQRVATPGPLTSGLPYTLRLEHLSDGLYFLRATREDETRTTRLVIAR